MSDTPAIEDYALIGDTLTSALVSREGSIDWMCLPQFDSPACFAALLGHEHNGRWKIAPADEKATSKRRYHDDTLVLETEFSTATGTVRLTDFMAVELGRSVVVRRVTGLSGEVDMRMDLTIRFDYGQRVPWVSRHDDGALLAVSGPHCLAFRSPVETHGEDHSTAADFTVREGETRSFTMSYGKSFQGVPQAIDPEAAFEKTTRFWSEWAAKCTYDGPWRNLVVRSLITLKALTFSPTGGIVGAPTTSLPEQWGGDRNWDYRFCWLRDATFTLLSLMGAGYRSEAQEWRKWLVRAIAGNAEQLQPLYTILGENRTLEWEADWLMGFGDARPVRIGNAAFSQLQLDSFGEILDALHHARKLDLARDHDAWELQKELLGYLEKIRDEKDSGIWEMRGPKRHFTHSKVMIWVAFDRAVSAVEDFDLDGPVDKWRRLRDDLHAEICEKGFDKDMGAFVQSYGSKELDASCLLIPIVGFLPPEDPRIVGTVEAIEKHLMRDGLVLRYRTSSGTDGLSGDEGVFLACSFWMVDNLVLLKRKDDAEKLFEHLMSLCNDVGLLSEEFDTNNGRQLGNFPQALSHLALINSALNLRDGHSPARTRSGENSKQ